MLKKLNVTKLKVITFSVLTATLAAMHPVSAATISQTLTVNKYLPTGSTYAGSFDVASLLTGSGYTGYKVDSVTLTFVAESPRNLTQTGTEVGTPYNVNTTTEAGTITRFFTTQDVDRTFLYEDNTVDALTVAVGKTSNQYFVTEQDEAVRTYLSTTSVNNCTNVSYLCIRTRYTTTNYSNTEIVNGFYGPLTANYTFKPSDLAQLSLTGLLDFSLSVDVGQFYLRTVAFAAEISPVPLPSAALLLATGLMPLIAARRRKSLQQRP